MNRYFFLTKDIDDLVHVEQELEQRGVLKEQMHILPNSDAVAEQSGLNSVDSLSRKDLFGSLAVGFGIGCAVAAALMVGALLFGAEGLQTWLMIGFIGLMIVGVCTWEGGLYGIETPRRQFQRFARDLRRGYSVFFVDIDKSQEQALMATAKQHKHLRPVGSGSGESELLLKLRHNWNEYSRAA